jgi:glycosyltransferase involved in cell wall biosynthesis
MILHVISGLGVGGAEAMLVRLAGALHARGIPQHVVSVTDRSAYADALRILGVEVTSLGLSSAASGFSAVYRLKKLVEHLSPDVIQGWMYHGDTMAMVAHRLARGGESRRLFWNVRASNMDAARYGRIVRLCAFMSAWPDAIIVNSHAGAEYHLASGYRPRRIEIIPNGIDTDRFCPDVTARTQVRSELGISGDAIVAIHIARVDPMKDHATFLASIADLPNLTAVLVGKGTQSLSVPANVRALGLREDVSRLCAGADVVVSSSIYGEGFPSIVAEGMSCGLIPIATDVGDARLIVGDTGYVVPHGDMTELAAALNKVASTPPAERRSQGLRARDRILENYTLRRAVDHYARLYGSA